MMPLLQFAACLVSTFLLVPLAPLQAAPAGPAAGLTIAVSAAPKTLNPALATDVFSARLLQLTHPALLRYNTTYQPVGLVATACVADSLTQVSCQLPTQLAFSDGTAFTAPLAQAWFQQLQANPRSPFSSQLRGISITAPTSSTLVLVTPSPTLTLLPLLAEIPLAHPSTTLGLGAYQLHNQSAAGNVVLTRTSSTIGLNGPAPSQLTFVALPDPTTRLLKLKKAELDIVLHDLPPQLVQWASAQGYPTLSTASTSYSYLGFNFNHPVLALPSVREALTLALNRPALRRFLLGSYAAPASTLLPPGHPAAWPAPEEPFDVFAAESLLDDSIPASGPLADRQLLRGPDNMRFALTLLTSTDALSQRVSQALQAQFAAVGVQLNLRPTEWASFYTAVTKGNYDLVLLSWAGELNPSFYYNAFNGQQVPPLGLNRGRVNDPTLNTLTTQLMAATTPAEQTELAIRIQQTLAEVRPYIPLYRRQHVMVTRPGLIGCTVPPSGAYTGLLTCHRAP